MTTVGSRPEQVEAGVPRERELQRRLGEFVGEVEAAIEATIAQRPIPPVLQDDAVRLVETAQARLLERIRSSAPGSPGLTELAELAIRASDLQAHLREHTLKRRRRALAGVSSAVSRMRCMNTTDELVQAACVELVRSCGFSRAMISRVSDRNWSPWMGHFAHRPINDKDREWMSTARIPLDSMIIEREVLQDHRPAYVTDVDADPRTLKTFIDSVGTRSYAVAAIYPDGQVVGFLHADHYPSSRPVDEMDCHVLGEFADAFGRIYERVSLLERLRGQRDHVRETLRSAEAIMDNVARAELELARKADQRSMAGAAAALALDDERAKLDELLTPREREVIALIVSGQSNSAIAERLVISEGTVKSHVKQILRKLGAVNRSEVIARYMGMAG